MIDFNPALFEAYDAAGSDMLADGMKQSDMWTPFTAVVMALTCPSQEQLEDWSTHYRKVAARART